MRAIMRTRTVILLSLSTSLAAGAAIKRDGESTLEWKACDTVGNTTTELLCSKLQVPRDYSDPDCTETITLKIAKSPATKEPKKSSILMNPGGPGYAGRNDLDQLHPIMQTILGGHHDVISWDFRGTGETLPVDCFATEAERAMFNDQLLAQTTNGSNVAAGEAWATASWVAAVCKNSTHVQDIGELVGTAYTARDMMHIVDALGEDGLLRYWGVSYGSALGEAVAAMFPDRMERVMIDAVVDPKEWFAGGSVSQISDADALFEDFLKECLEAPEVCLLSQRGTSVDDLASKIYTMLEDIKYNPAVFGPYGILPYGNVKYLIIGFLYSRSLFGTLDLLLDTLLTRNTTQYGLFLASQAPTGPVEQKPFPDYSTAQAKENTWGIRCTDEALRADSLDEMMPILEAFHNNSRIIGDVSWSTNALGCAQWPYRAKERLRAGQFHDIKTKYPLLIVQNQFDPVTSVEAARNTRDAFPGSKLVINGGHGHGILSEPTLCGIKAVRAFFDDGILPDEDETLCESKAPPFVTQELEDVLAGDDEDAA